MSPEERLREEASVILRRLNRADVMLCSAADDIEPWEPMKGEEAIRALMDALRESTLWQGSALRRVP
jgi:hypothetical protein